MTQDINSVAFVDDDGDMREAHAQALELAGFNVLTFDCAEAALQVLDDGFPGIIVSDIRMPGLDGHQFSRRIRALDQDLPVVLITGHGDIDEAVQALHDGAYDFLAKPYATERLVATIGRAMEKRKLVIENRRLRRASEREDPQLEMIGDSQAMRKLRTTILRLAAADVDVLIEGETGVGKELVARALHAEGPRRMRPFVVIDCATLNAETIEQELFGHETGVFNGAVRKRVGRIESAHRGTLLLDDIESLPPHLQGRFLRVLEEREITPLGANEARPVDIRVLATAKGDLESRIGAGGFRADLYYRLNVARIAVPSLRQRRDDVPRLFATFLSEACDRLRKPAPEISETQRRRLFEYDWPGNIRELRHFASKVAIGAEDEDTLAEVNRGPTPLAARVDAYEAQLLREALAVTNGDVRETLAILQVPRKTFYDKLKRHRIDIDSFRPVPAQTS